MSVASLMNTTVSIETETTVKNSSGLNTRAWTQTQAAIPCRVSDVSESMRVQYGRLGHNDVNVFYFATDPAIFMAATKTRIVWAGGAYYPLSTVNAGGQLNRVWQIIAEKKPLVYSING